MRYLRFLGPLDWDRVPSRALKRRPMIAPIPYAPFVAACLVNVDQQIGYMSQLRTYLGDHPALTWVLGFPLRASPTYTWGFDVDPSLPTHRHFTRMLRNMPNETLQFLLDSTVTERIHAQAVALGIERPKMHNEKAIANQNTLMYIVINLRALQRVREHILKQPVTSPSVRVGQVIYRFRFFGIRSESDSVSVPIVRNQSDHWFRFSESHRNQVPNKTTSLVPLYNAV